MRLTVNFRNPSDGTVTLWSVVSFSYIVVSRTFSGSYSDIWATVAEATNPADTFTTPVSNAAFDAIGVIYQRDTSTNPFTAKSCVIYTDPFYSVDAACDASTPIVAATLSQNGKQIVHTYIMGFIWNPAKTTKQYLSLGVLPKSTSPATFD